MIQMERMVSVLQDVLNEDRMRAGPSRVVFKKRAR